MRVSPRAAGRCKLEHPAQIRSIAEQVPSTGFDGAPPLSSVAFDASGNLYGTTTFGGHGGQGTLWQLTP
jgi:uncharacterized repeat protein (TIGR03803 family)